MTRNRSIETVPLNTYELNMSPQGIRLLLEDTMFRKEIGTPQVYIHVGTVGPLKDQVIRIGQAKNGAFDRWRSSSGHCKTFLHAIGAEEGYSRPWLYPNYLAFFAGLNELPTKLHVVSCDSASDMHQLEQRLIKNQFGPIWEQYRSDIKRYFKQSSDAGELFSRFGGSWNQLEKQRAGISDLPTPVPDVLDYRSARSWDLGTWTGPDSIG